MLVPVEMSASSAAALDQLLERVRRGEEGPALMAAIEDALATASLAALKSDMRRRRVSERIDELTGGSLDEDAVSELRELVGYRAQLERDANAVRGRVADLRETFATAGGMRIS